MPTFGRTQGHRRRAHRFATLAAAGVLVAAATVSGGAGVAYAASSTTCLGTSSITYAPGITFTPRTSTYAETDTYSSCLSSDPAVTSGGFADSFTGSFSCLNPLVTGTSDYTVSWNNAQSSTFTLTFTDTIVAGVETVTGTGTVTAGQFLGAAATIVWVYTVPNPLACLTPAGLTSQSGTIVATIVGT